MKIGAGETIFRYSRPICLITQIVVSVFYPVYLAAWLISGLAVSVFYLYTQRAAASGRLGRATQETYYRHTGGSRHITVQCCLGCMLAPPVWLAGLVSRHIRSARRLREQRQRAEPVAVAEPGAWAKAAGEER